MFLIGRIFGTGAALVPSTGRVGLSWSLNLILQLILTILLNNEINMRADRRPHAPESSVAVPKVRPVGVGIT
jgi:hypothetical protein